MSLLEQVSKQIKSALSSEQSVELHPFHNPPVRDAHTLPDDLTEVR